MKTSQHSSLANWSASTLEEVSSCPYCNSNSFVAAYNEVSDWSFGVAPGLWNYADCLDCGALFLLERPTEDAIHLAYQGYYTHEDEDARVSRQTLAMRVKHRLNNECLSVEFGINVTPRLNLHAALRWLVYPIIPFSAKPYPITELSALRPGNFLDVGCGSGATVQLANAFGWNASGIDADPMAVAAARARGLNVQLGSYEILKKYEGAIDCIVCSHVLEHVYRPIELLLLIRRALRPVGGMLLLSLPNSSSALRYFFGAKWRGLEAPRHISIPSEAGLVKLLKNIGFEVVSDSDDSLSTAAESFRIRRGAMTISMEDQKNAKRLQKSIHFNSGGSDFIKLRCKTF